MAVSPKIQLYGQLIHTLEEEVHALHGRVVLASKEAQRGDDHPLLDQALADLDAMQGERDAALAVNRGQSVAINTYKEKIAELRQNIEDWSGRWHELDAEAEERQSRIVELSAECSSLKLRCQQEEDSRRVLSDALDKSKAENADLSAECDRLTRKHEKLISESSETEKLYAASVDRVTEMGAELATETKRADVLTAQIADRDREIIALKSQLQTLQDSAELGAPTKTKSTANKSKTKHSKNGSSPKRKRLSPTPPDGYVLIKGVRRSKYVRDGMLIFNRSTEQFEDVAESMLGKRVSAVSPDDNLVAEPADSVPETQKLYQHSDTPPAILDGYYSVSGGKPIQSGDLVAKRGAKMWVEPQKIAIGRTPISNYFAVIRPKNGETI